LNKWYSWGALKVDWNEQVPGLALKKLETTNFPTLSFTGSAKKAPLLGV